MQITIGVDTVIKFAALLTALGVIGGVVAWCIRFVDRQKKQDEEIAGLREEIAGLREESSLLCKSLSACLDGLMQLGVNHSVPSAKEELDVYLNEKAHQNKKMKG